MGLFEEIIEFMEENGGARTFQVYTVETEGGPIRVIVDSTSTSDEELIEGGLGKYKTTFHPTFNKGLQSFE